MLSVRALKCPAPVKWKHVTDDKLREDGCPL
jgi:hypothetical protein